jgi:hypothetical protein
MLDRIVQRDVRVRKPLVDPLRRELALADVPVLPFEDRGCVAAQVEARKADSALAELALKVIIDEGEIETARSAADDRLAEAAHFLEPGFALEHRGLWRNQVLTRKVVGADVFVRAPPLHGAVVEPRAIEEFEISRERTDEFFLDGESGHPEAQHGKKSGTWAVRFHVGRDVKFGSLLPLFLCDAFSFRRAVSPGPAA